MIGVPATDSGSPPPACAATTTTPPTTRCVGARASTIPSGPSRPTRSGRRTSRGRGVLGRRRLAAAVPAGSLRDQRLGGLQSHRRRFAGDRAGAAIERAFLPAPGRRPSRLRHVASVTLGRHGVVARGQGRGQAHPLGHPDEHGVAGLRGERPRPPAVVGRRRLQRRRPVARDTARTVPPELARRPADAGRIQLRRRSHAARVEPHERALAAELLVAQRQHARGSPGARRRAHARRSTDDHPAHDEPGDPRRSSRASRGAPTRAST